jgi:hypothetical protein
MDLPGPAMKQAALRLLKGIRRIINQPFGHALTTREYQDYETEHLYVPAGYYRSIPGFFRQR